MNLEFELNKYFGFNCFRENQKEIIESVISGENVFVIMPTGAGKSMCYQLPALVMSGTAVVISPLISLMKDQVEKFGMSSVRYYNSTLGLQEKEELEFSLLCGNIKLLYISPESISTNHVIDLLRHINISFFAVDEAHCISEWGFDFRPSYLKLRSVFNLISSNSNVIALTASATRRVQGDIIKVLFNFSPHIFKTSFNRPNLTYKFCLKSSKMDFEILNYIQSHFTQSGLVYCYSRETVERVCNYLISNGVSALPYHAGLSKDVRDSNQNDFLSSKVQVMVCTTAFGMGIDKSDIRFVIHYDVPPTIESYYQETGRAGRDGNSSLCLSYYSYSDFLKYNSFNSRRIKSERRIYDLLLSDVINLCESEDPHKYILFYFGEIGSSGLIAG